MSNDTRFPDIEVYVRSIDTEALAAWLKDTVGADLQPTGPQTWHGQGRGLDEAVIPCLLVERAMGSFTSIWFDSDATPWPRDIDCARALHAALGGEVRCSPGGWLPGDAPDTFVKLIHGVESVIEWT